MTEQTTPLRQRMIDDMKVRNMSALTQKAYVRSVKNFAAFHGTALVHHLRARARGWRLSPALRSVSCQPKSPERHNQRCAISTVAANNPHSTRRLPAVQYNKVSATAFARRAALLRSPTISETLILCDP